MPTTTKRGKAKESELPDTLRRSPAKAQRTFAVEGSSKRELYQPARKFGVGGRSRMSKEELAEAIARSG